MSQHRASTPVSPLRRRMLDDMVLRGLHEDTPDERRHCLAATGCDGR